MAETFSHESSLCGRKRNRKRPFCGHCNREVSKATFYRHKVQFTEDSEFESASESDIENLESLPGHGNEEETFEAPVVSCVKYWYVEG